MPEIFEAIQSFGIIGVLVYMFYYNDTKQTKEDASHRQEIKYYRTLAFSLLTVVLVSVVEDENKLKAIVESMNRPAEEARSG